MSESLTLEQLLKEVDVPPHMINLWTKKFPIFSPQRNNDGKLCFKMRDIAFVKGLKHLLIQENETIKNVQALLNEKGIAYIADIGKNPDSYKNPNPNQNHQNQNHRVSFASSLTSKSKMTITDLHKQVAKKAFNNLNSIFNKEKTVLPEQTVSYIPTEDIPFTENPILPETIPHSDSDIHNNNNNDDCVTPSFEENWRNLMEKKGKATPLEQVRDKPDMMYDDTEAEANIWFVDDEVNLFDDESADISEILPTLTQKAPPMRHAQDNPPSRIQTIAPQGLTIQQTEKIKHLIARLEIMRDEMMSANSVITKTLKAFGYSSFENAYDKFDDKSVY